MAGSIDCTGSSITTKRNGLSGSVARGRKTRERERVQLALAHHAERGRARRRRRGRRTRRAAGCRSRAARSRPSDTFDPWRSACPVGLRGGADRRRGAGRGGRSAVAVEPVLGELHARERRRRAPATSRAVASQRWTRRATGRHASSRRSSSAAAAARSAADRGRRLGEQAPAVGRAAARLGDRRGDGEHRRRAPAPRRARALPACVRRPAGAAAPGRRRSAWLDVDQRATPRRPPPPVASGAPAPPPPGPPSRRRVRRSYRRPGSRRPSARRGSRAPRRAGRRSRARGRRPCRMRLPRLDGRPQPLHRRRRSRPRRGRRYRRARAARRDRPPGRRRPAAPRRRARPRSRSGWAARRGGMTGDGSRVVDRRELRQERLTIAPHGLRSTLAVEPRPPQGLARGVDVLDPEHGVERRVEVGGRLQHGPRAASRTGTAGSAPPPAARPPARPPRRRCRGAAPCAPPRAGRPPPSGAAATACRAGRRRGTGPRCAPRPAHAGSASLPPDLRLALPARVLVGQQQLEGLREARLARPVAPHHQRQARARLQDEPRRRPDAAEAGDLDPGQVRTRRGCVVERRRDVRSLDRRAAERRVERLAAVAGGQHEVRDTVVQAAAVERLQHEREQLVVHRPEGTPRWAAARRYPRRRRRVPSAAAAAASAEPPSARRCVVSHRWTLAGRASSPKRPRAPRSAG